MSNKFQMDPALYKKFLASINPMHLELRLFATEKCNFRCVYCYEDFELGRMPKWLRNGIKKLIEQRCKDGLISLYVSWFGGEPLLALEVIEEIETFRGEMLRKYPAMLHVNSGITTNGYLLTVDVLEKLVNLGVKSYQITLDGPEDQHNLTRRRADGHGTFDVIFENLLAASKTDLDFRIDIRMHLHQANVEIVKGDLTDLLIQNFSKDPRFNLHPISIGDYGGAFNDGNVTTTTHRIAADSRELILDRFASARRAHFQSIDLYSDRPIAHQSSTAAEGNAVVCYAAAANSFAIRSDGRVVKCTTALEDPRNVIGKISENGQLSINPDLVKLWMVGFASGKTGELACPLHKVSTMKVPGGKKIIPIVEQI